MVLTFILIRDFSNEVKALNVDVWFMFHMKASCMMIKTSNPPVGIFTFFDYSFKLGCSDQTEYFGKHQE